MPFAKAVGMSVAVMAVTVFLLNPVSREPYDRPGSILEETLGVVIIGSAVLTLLVAPVLHLMRRAAGRVTVAPIVWATVGGLVALSPIVAFNEPGGSVAQKMLTTLDGLRTVRGFASWGPYLVGGAFLGWRMHAIKHTANSVETP